MGHINLPVKTCTIIYRYYGWGPDKKSHRYYEDSFDKISKLRDYFKRIPGAGPLVGYGKKESHHAWAFSATIQLEWTDAVMYVKKEFADVHEFAKFIEDHPPLAEMVEYVKK
jgi:hypothetical protein